MSHAPLDRSLTAEQPRLLSEMSLGALVVRNRAWVSPMCQYSCFARDGLPTPWHLVHLGSMATGGFGLIITEATAVVPEGRISPEDTGLWSDAHSEAWRPVVDFVHGQGARIAVQLAHAGRKASTFSPLFGEDGSVPAAEGGWETVGPSAGGFGDLTPCRALSLDEVRSMPARFAEAAGRAADAGFDAVEIHAAHGYLLHQFLSPLVNHREDEYGGDFEGRTRLLREVVAATREALPSGTPVLLRVSATDWAEGGWDLAQTVELAASLRHESVDLIDVSSGGAVAHQKIDVGPHYQVPFSEQVRAGGGLATGAVGLIEDPQAAEQILREGAADVVLLGRAALRDSRWPLRAARELGVASADAPYPAQYRRAVWRPLATASPSEGAPPRAD